MVRMIRIADDLQHRLLDGQVELHVLRQLGEEETQNMPRVALGHRVLEGQQVLKNLLVLIVDHFDADRQTAVPLHGAFLVATTSAEPIR